MNPPVRRYIFLDFSSLQKVDLQKLEKVCNKLFIFVDEAVAAVPLSVVLPLQKWGKRARWISVPSTDDGFNQQIAFVMGNLHQKVYSDIEFAVLSDDTRFDDLVYFIDQRGRRALRIAETKDAKTETVSETFSTPEFPFGNKNFPSSPEHIESNFSLGGEPATAAVAEGVESISEIAQETKVRLQRSGYRPAELSSLREYIGMHMQAGLQVEKVIESLVDNSDLEIIENEVSYFF